MDLFPDLKGLSGGKKQAWINANLDLITLLNQHWGFDKTGKVLKMKADTLSRALQKAENNHRPTVTRADKAINMTQINQAAIYELQNKAEHLQDVLEEHINDENQLRNILSKFCMAQATIYTILSQLISGVVDTSNLTYHIDSVNKLKVDPTQHKLGDRLSSISGPESKRLSGPVLKRNTHHQRKTIDGKHNYTK